ncbi:uncharacterized protein METZ01_LOCUS176726 [marine metagenome]|uniref:Maleate cis-trans isomerase n=1 Tax=marine metagenome TaxID=408172 RepID=A0A382CDF5_9ZZZZ
MKAIRIGILVPSTNQVVEPDFMALVPPGVTFHTERLWNVSRTPPGGGDGTYLQNMNNDLERGVASLTSANLDILVYACTSGTYHSGNIEYNNLITKKIEHLSGLPAITAVTASIEALSSIAPGNISIIGPYGQVLLTKRLTPLLESQGFSVIDARGESSMLQRTHDSVIGDQDPELIYDFVINSVHPKTDTIFLPGTAWRTLEIVHRLEEHLQRRVISVNQATIWSTFKKLGVRTIGAGFGSLFDL